MARHKANQLHQYEQILVAMTVQKTVTPEDVNKLFAKTFTMQHISFFMHNIKKNCGGKLETKKNGRNIVSYTLTNVEDMKKYLESRKKEIGYVEQHSTEKPQIQEKQINKKIKTIKELNGKELPKEQHSKVETLTVEEID